MAKIFGIFGKRSLGPIIGKGDVGTGPVSDLPYADYGYIPHVAQQAQANVPANPFLNPQPYFSDVQNAIANWYTNRVHLSPLGNAFKE